MARAKRFDCKTCTVCRHPERLRIEMLRLAGTTADALADRFGLKRDAIYRHTANHVSDADKAAMLVDTDMRELAERAAEEGGALLDYYSLVRKTVLQQMLGAASINDRGSTASLARAATDVLSQIGRLTGELVNASGVTNNIINNIAIMQSPAFARLEAMLLQALTPFPDALKAVLTGLEALETEELRTATVQDVQRPPRPVLELEAAHA